MTDSFPARVAGKRGLRESHEPRLLRSRFMDPFPSAPASWDGTHGFTQWGMDGNDQWGCCGAAGTDHGNMAKAGNLALLNTLGRPKYAGTLPTYWAYGIAMGEPGPTPDQGVDNATWLGWLWKQGIIDGYVEIPLSELRQAAPGAGGLLVGCLLGDDAEADFEKSIPWDDGPSDPPDPNDGHDICLAGFDANGRGRFVTWGALQWATAAWMANNPTDAWLILDADDPAVNWPELIAELTPLHGSLTPPPTPAPTPAPPSGCWGTILRVFGR